MTAAEIERLRLGLAQHYTEESTINDLCALALDGLRFRIWIDEATHRPGRVAKALADCLTPNQYRTAIDSLIVASARRG